MHRLMVTEAAQHALGVGAAIGVVAPSPVYGNFLNTHGFLLLSYTEWMKIIGSIYIIFMIISLFVKFCMHVKKNIKRREYKEPLVMSPRFADKKFMPFSRVPSREERKTKNSDKD